MSRQRSGTPWTPDELTVACGLYFTIPFGRMHKSNARIVEVAALLGRTPSSLAMKLVNFASLDPEHRARGVRGLAGHSRADEEIWNRFRQNWPEMGIRAESLLGALRHPATTEKLAETKVRTAQSYFRKTVLAAYNSTCCITGNPVEALLTASHILPWSEFPAERLNPRNGLCLAAHFDRAFDQGLIAFGDDLRLLLGPALRRHLKNPAIAAEFLAREHQPLTPPERFLPDPAFLAYHRVHRFGRLQP